MRILITGSGGFIGSHVFKYLNTVNFVCGLQRDNSHGMATVTLLKDLRVPLNESYIKFLKGTDVIIHLAAMSHVDRSIKDPYSAVMDNVVGTFNLLELARKVKPKLFLYFSTDEVFGPNIHKEKFKEWDRFNPGSPYSATKAAGEDLCLAYHNTYGVPVIITHCMNVFGSGQHEEKFMQLNKV